MEGDKSTKIRREAELISVDLSSLKIELQQELRRLLNFWKKETLDKTYGGFIGQMNHSGEKISQAPKGSILNTRILWTFSAAYRTTKIENYKEVAKISYNYISQYFMDAVNGGVFWELDYLGNPVNKRKQAYAQSFAIYGFSEYYRATKNAESLDKAIALYKLLEANFWDEKYSGYIEALTENWSPIDDMRLSEKDLNAPKSMNTHLHILEAYSNLYRVWPDEGLKRNIINLLDIFKNNIIDKASEHFNLFFDLDWQVKSSAISFGHDIEGAWLLHEAAEVINDKYQIESIQKIALNLVDITLNEGLDEDGSLFNEFEHNTLDKDKHWWPQAEAMVGLMDAYQINPKPDYLNHIYKLWSFIKSHLIDTKNGEWFWRVNSSGNSNPTDDKVGFWKCPYHNSRALMELTERIEKLDHVK